MGRSSWIVSGVTAVLAVGINACSGKQHASSVPGVTLILRHGGRIYAGGIEDTVAPRELHLGLDVRRAFASDRRTTNLSQSLLVYLGNDGQSIRPLGIEVSKKGIVEKEGPILRNVVWSLSSVAIDGTVYVVDSVGKDLWILPSLNGKWGRVANKTRFPWQTIRSAKKFYALSGGVMVFVLPNGLCLVVDREKTYSVKGDGIVSTETGSWAYSKHGASLILTPLGAPSSKGVHLDLPHSANSLDMVGRLQLLGSGRYLVARAQNSGFGGGEAAIIWWDLNSSPSVGHVARLESELWLFLGVLAFSQTSNH